ncbi:MAG: DUF6879 family protein, partial [Streptosporangiaceae bacterium]
PLANDPARDEWTTMVRAAVTDGKVFQRVHLVAEPLTAYVRYEMTWWYGPNAQAGDDVRILPANQVPAGVLPSLCTLDDYWLFDSGELWIMYYAPDGAFRHAEQISDPAAIVSACYWRDAALHYAVPYADYMRRAELLAAS